MSSNVLEQLDQLGAVLLDRHFVYKSGKHGPGYINPDLIFSNLALASDLASQLALPFAGEVEAYIRDALKRKNPDRPLDTNVEFFTAILLDALKIPRQAFTPIFAVARAAGWTAHAREQQRGGRLIRPSSAYIGPMPG